jgi:hypothetical protein
MGGRRTRGSVRARLQAQRRMTSPTVFVTMTLTDDELSEMKRAAPEAAFR